MKRIYIAIVLLIVAAGVGAIEYAVISRGSEYYIGRLDSAEGLIEQGKFAEAQKVCRETARQFDGYTKNALYYFYNHNSTRELGENIDKLGEYLKLGRIDDFAVMKKTVKKQLLVLRDKERICLKNIL